jgi:hypothetical protein
VILCTWEVEVRGSGSKANLSKNLSEKQVLKKEKGLRVWPR